MANNSLRKLAEAKVVRKLDMFGIDPRNLVIEKGFNLRTEGAAMIDKAEQGGRQKATKKDQEGPKMRSRKQIEAAYAGAKGDSGFALAWVLGLTDSLPAT